MKKPLRLFAVFLALMLSAFLCGCLPQDVPVDASASSSSFLLTTADTAASASFPIASTAPTAVSQSTPSTTVRSTTTATTNPSVPADWDANVPTRNVGSAKELKGRCVIFDVYLSDAASSFTSAEKQTEEDDESSALQYLTAQAAVNHVSLTFLYGQSDLQYDYTVSSTIPATVADSDWASAVCQTVRTKYHFDTVAQQYHANNVSVFLHVDKTADASYTVQCDGYYNFFELSVMYTRLYDTGGGVSGNYPFVYAHELLHQFGAIDLYYPYHPDDPRVALAANEFPNDLMRVFLFDLTAATWSDVDLYMIGWLDSLPAADLIYIQPPYG